LHLVVDEVLSQEEHSSLYLLHDEYFLVSHLSQDAAYKSKDVYQCAMLQLAKDLVLENEWLIYLPG